jgi:hypothetical protein
MDPVLFGDTQRPKDQSPWALFDKVTRFKCHAIDISNPLLLPFSGHISWLTSPRFLNNLTHGQFRPKHPNGYS